MANNDVGFWLKGQRAFLCSLMMMTFVAHGQIALGQMRIRTFEIGGIVWKYGVQGDQAIITSGDSSVPVIPPETRGRVKLPRDIDGFRVNRLDAFAFVGCRFLREVDLSNNRDYLDVGYGLFSGCTSLKRVIFPRNLYLISSVGPSRGRSALFEGCDSLEEIVFLGGVPNIRYLDNLGISLNNRLRFTAQYEKQWRIYVEDYNITGWALWDESKKEEVLEENSPSPSDFEDIDFSQADYESDDPKMDSIVKLAANFKGLQKSVEASYEKSRAELMQQRADLLMKGKKKAQLSGDLDAVMMYDEALQSEEPIETENESLLSIYKQISTAELKLKRARDEKSAKLVDALCSHLESLKVKETKAGNFDLAQEIKSYEDRVKALSGLLQKRAKAFTGNSDHSPSHSNRQGGGATDAARTQPRSASSSESNAKPSSSGPISVPGAMSYSVSVTANDEKGNFIGGTNFEKGDLLIIHYMGGEVKRYRGSSYSINPDKRETYYYYSSSDDGERSRTHSIVKIEGPHGSRTKITRQLPYGTERSPYVFEVPESGRYRLIGFLDRYAEGKASYQVWRVTKFNSQTFRSSPLSKRCQW